MITTWKNQMSKPYILHVQLVNGAWKKWGKYKTKKAANQASKAFVKRFQTPLLADMFRFNKPKVIKND